MKGMTDKEIWALIEQTEREGMLDPPVGFQDEVLWRIRQKRKRRKDMQLFSYSAKVFITMAAALLILFTVPATIDPEAWISEQLMNRQEEEIQLLGPVQDESIKSEDTKNKWISGTDMFLDRISAMLDQYCGRINDGLDQLVKWRK